MNFKLSLLLDKVPLSRPVKHILRAIAKHTNSKDETPTAWVRQKTLAKEESMSLSTVSRNIQKAEALGLLIVRKQFHSNRRQKHSEYQVNLIALFELAGTKAYHDQLPVTESNVTDLPDIGDMLAYIEKQDPHEREKLTRDQPSQVEALYKNVPICAKSFTSKENTLFINNLKNKFKFGSQRSHYGPKRRGSMEDVLKAFAQSLIDRPIPCQ